jgi:hypothetical protein
VAGDPAHVFVLSVIFLAWIEPACWRSSTSPALLLLRAPVVAEGAQPGEGFPVFGPVGRFLAGDDVIGMADRETFHFHMALPGIRELFEAVGRKNQIQVEGAVLELDEVLSPQDFRGFPVGEIKAKLPQRGDDSGSIGGGFLDVEVGVLSGIRVSQQDRAGFAEEQVTDPVPGEDIADLLRLTVFKRGHSPAMRGGVLRTSGGSLPWCPTSGSGRHP